jgi:NADH-quinone oxidoreductase subunit L
MFLAVGAGAFVAAIFHLMTHAFFKALLFLGSGSVIEAAHHEQDIQKMGGIGKKMPVTRTTFVIGSLALAGVPIFAGFFSKDEILFNTMTSGLLGPLGKVLWVVGAAAALLTAFYITRCVVLTFYGKPRDKHIFDGIKESPAVMTVPLVILAVLSTVGGFLGLPLVPRLNAMHNWLSPVVGGGHAAAEAGHGMEAGMETAVHGAAQAAHEAGHSMGFEVLLMAASVALAVAGIAAAWRVYAADPRRAEALGERFRGAYRVLWGKYYVDELYNATVVQPLVQFSNGLWKLFDVKVVDGLVNGAGRVMRGFGGALRPIQTGITGNYATAIMIGAIIIIGYVVLGGWR